MFFCDYFDYRIWGSHIGSYEELRFLECTVWESNKADVPEEHVASIFGLEE
jgi:hypothetical protein